MQQQVFGLGLIENPNVRVYVWVDTPSPQENEKEAKRRMFHDAKLKLYSDGAEATRFFPL